MCQLIPVFLLYVLDIQGNNDQTNMMIVILAFYMIPRNCRRKRLKTHDIVALNEMCISVEAIFSSPGRSPGRAIVLPPALVLALAAASALAKC